VVIIAAGIQASILVIFGAALSSYLGEPLLETYLIIVAFQTILGAFYVPVGALLQREMRFATLAYIDIATAIFGAALTIGLAWYGAGALSFAWAGLLQAALATVLGVLAYPVFWAFKPCRRHLLDVFSFGIYVTLANVIGRVYDLLTITALGRFLSLTEAGIYNRATMVSDLPIKGLLNGIFPVVLPALSHALRSGHSLKSAFLNSINLVTAIMWPGLIIVSLLSHPITDVLLGTQWAEAPPLVSIIALASIFSFPAFLVAPILMLTGPTKSLLNLRLLTLPACLVILSVSAHFGIYAAALSGFITIPLQNIVALAFIRKHIDVSWLELALSVRKSLAVTAYTITAPLGAIMINGFSLDLPIWAGIAAGTVAALFWVKSLEIVDHPLESHIRDILRSLDGKIRRAKFPLPKAAVFPTSKN
jgi:O-antigen/teichoic acid export membrane protein